MKKTSAVARKGSFAALGTALALALPASAQAIPVGPFAAVPDGNVTVEVVAASGSGCAPGTAWVATSPDKSGFRIRYGDFAAEAGGGAETTARRRNCQLGVVVGVPAGWTFAVAEVDYRGRARLLSGATGLQRTNYYWQGSSDNSRTDETFAGPYNGYWGTRDVARELVYLPCGQQRILNINTELRVDAGASGGRSGMSMTATDGDVDTLFNFAWTRC